MATVSIIVPVYNGERYLKQCLNSLLKQSLDDIEIICVDNCSNDASFDIAKDYALNDRRVIAVQQERNRGQGNSVNRGWDMATGEYIAECDADDYVAPNMYETLYNRAQGADVAWGGWYDLECGEMRRRGVGGSNEPFNPMTDLDRKTRFGFLQYQPHILSAIYKREFMNDNGLRYRDDTTYEDLSLSFRIRTTAKSYMLVPKNLYVYRRDNPNSGTATIQDSMSIFEQYDNMFQWNELHGLGLDKELKTMRFYSSLWASTRVPNQEDDFWKEAGRIFKTDSIDNEFFFTERDYRYYCDRRDKQWT